MGLQELTQLIQGNTCKQTNVDMDSKWTLNPEITAFLFVLNDICVSKSMYEFD